VKPQNLRLGIALMSLTSLIFSLQDGISRHLAGAYNPYLVVMFRFWFLALFALGMAASGQGGLRAAIRTRMPALQVLRGICLAAEISVMMFAFVALGLVESHAVFACYPLLIAALSGPILGEKVGWRRWTAIAVGALGVMIVLQPGGGVFSVLSVIPFVSALLFAFYGLLTRYVARSDTASASFLWTGIVGAVVMTPFGLAHWQAMTPADAAWMLTLCCTSAAAHWTMIRAFEVAEASAIQPFAYLQLVFISILGIGVFHEVLRPNVAIGAAIIVAAGVFTLWRERRVRGLTAPSASR
jgi:drug/metabolite transporter (DMT)-like permease